jgi:MoxR-like ATPase
MAKALEPQSLEYIGDTPPRTRLPGDSLARFVPYLPDPDLVEAVNVAIYLGRPLLIKGEPGSGKTRLARAVADEFTWRYNGGKPWPYYAWYIKSISRAQDGLYTYDSVGRLRDAHLVGAGRIADADLPRVNDPATYRHLGVLGHAFKSDKRAIVLIDEIDKADIDFPNDLLLELDEQRFFIQETNEEIAAHAPPIVFITSNDEKDLPDAFLRRCVFYYIPFPDTQRLISIVKAHLPQTPNALVKAAVARFEELRKAMSQDKGLTGKRVSTSELIDWIKVLSRHGKDPALALLRGKLPLAGVLLKQWEDHRRYLSAPFQN